MHLSRERPFLQWNMKLLELAAASDSKSMAYWHHLYIPADGSELAARGNRLI